MSLRWMDIACSRCSVSEIIQFRRCIFENNKNDFRHLELDIVYTIPGSNERKTEANNLAGQVLI